MPDPIASIAAEAESGAPAIPAEGAAPEGPRFSDRALELFKPCPEDPLTKVGFISQTTNRFLSKRSGVPEDKITVGQNLAHCIDHLVPGGGAGLPPIVGLVKSLLDLRSEARKNPDTAPLVRP